MLAQFVAPDGSPSGGVLTMPGTNGMRIGMLGRTPLAALGGSPYVAYPTPNQIRVWRVGAANAPAVGRVRGSGSPAVALAPTADGRLWIVWTEGFGDPDVLARRTNVGARKFGAIVSAGHPRDAMQAYKVDGDAVGGALDVLGNFNIGTTTTAVPPTGGSSPASRFGRAPAGCEGASRPRCASPSSTPATPSAARGSRPTANPAGQIERAA